MSTDLFKNIHVFIQTVIKNMKLTDYRLGIVMQINPIRISLGDNKIITDVGTNVLYTEQVLEKKIQLNHIHTTSGLSHSHGGTSSMELVGKYDTSENLDIYIINESIKINDKLLMLRVAEGQKWIVLSKLRDKNKVMIKCDNTWNWS